MPGYNLSYRPNRVEGGRSSGMDLTHDQPVRYWPERDLGFSRAEPWRSVHRDEISEDYETEIERRFSRGTSGLGHYSEDSDDGNPRASICMAKGLMNPVGSNNCFMNCAIQVLWQLNVFRKNFRQLSGHACMQESCIFCALKVIFTQFEFSNRKVLTPDALRQALANNCSDQRRFQLSLMDDAAECFEIILLRLHTHLAYGVSEDACQESHCLAHQKFSMSIVEQFVCECDDTSDPLCYSQLVHYISTTSLMSLVQGELESPTYNRERFLSFGELLSRARDDGEEKRCPSNCGGKVQVRRTLTNTPEVLSVGLIWDTGRPSSVHIRDVVHTISTTLSPADLFYSAVEKTWAETSVFDLVGIVCYYGKHYSTFFLHPKMKTWLLYDDARVHELGSEWQSVVDKCCRSSFQPLLLLYTNRDTEPLDISTAPTCNFTIPQPQKDNQQTEQTALSCSQTEPETSKSKMLTSTSALDNLSLLARDSVTPKLLNDLRDKDKNNRYTKSCDINHNLPVKYPADDKSNPKTGHSSSTTSASLESLSSSSSRSTEASSSHMSGVKNLEWETNRYTCGVNQNSSSAYINPRKVQDLIAAQIGNYNAKQAFNVVSPQDVCFTEKALKHSTPAEARIDSDRTLPYTAVINSYAVTSLTPSDNISVLSPIDSSSDNIVTIVPRVLNHIEHISHADRPDGKLAQQLWKSTSIERYDRDFSSTASGAIGLSGVNSLSGILTFNDSSKSSTMMPELTYSSLQPLHSQRNNQNIRGNSDDVSSVHSATKMSAVISESQQPGKFISERTNPIQIKHSTSDAYVNSIKQISGRTEDALRISGKEDKFQLNLSKRQALVRDAERYLQVAEELFSKGDHHTALEPYIKSRDVLDESILLCQPGQLPVNITSLVTRLKDLEQKINEQKTRQRHRSDYCEPAHFTLSSTSRYNPSEDKIFKRVSDNTPVYATYRRNKVLSNNSMNIPVNSVSHGSQYLYGQGPDLGRSASFDIASRHHSTLSEGFSSNSKRHGFALCEGNNYFDSNSAGINKKVISYSVERHGDRDQVRYDEQRNRLQDDGRFNRLEKQDYRSGSVDRSVSINSERYGQRRPSKSEIKDLLVCVSSGSNIRDRDNQYGKTKDYSSGYTSVVRDRQEANQSKINAEREQIKDVYITTRQVHNPPSPFPGRSSAQVLECSASNFESGNIVVGARGRRSEYARQVLPSYTEAISNRR